MDLPSLSVILQATLSPNPDERKAAELNLNQLQYASQHLVRLLQIIVDERCDIAVRQVASIHFKNFIIRNWSPVESGEMSKISMSDKDVVRENILVFVAQMPTLLRAQLGECIKTIINTDYPEQWPSLLLWVKQSLQDQHVYGALFVLRILTRKYELMTGEDRIPVYLIVELTFPHILNIFSKLVHVANAPAEVADLVKLICKIFWSSVYLEIPKKLLDPEVFDAWMTLYLNLLERVVPTEGQPQPELRKSRAWWKVKKWTIHILNRLFTRFGDRKLPTPEHKAFALSFQNKYAGRILDSYLCLLNVLRTGGYLPDRVTNLILKFMRNSITKSSLYQLLQPRLEIVLFEIVFPLMCFNDNDQKLWDEDPHEYVRKGYDIFEDLYSPRAAAIDFVSELVRKHGKENLHKFIQFIVDIFKRYDEVPAEYKPYRQKDGALLAIGVLCDKLKQTDPYKSELENMLVHHVFPEFGSTVGHLRAKASWVSGQYAHINFSDQNNFRKALHSVVSALRDPEVPVRVDSVFAMRSFVEACQDLNEIRPMLPQLLDEFVKLMNEVENEDLVSTLKTIVDKFGEEMAPYAFGLCQSLVATFWRCMNTAAADSDADDHGALAAVGCLRTITTILQAVSKLPHLFIQIEPILLPIMRRMLTTDGQDVFEEVLEIVSYMTFFAPAISVDMWSLWPLIMQALSDWAMDFFPNILIPLVNYIYRGTTNFLTCKDPDYQHSLWTIILSIMGDKNREDGDIEPAPKLIGVVFQNCKGQVNQWLEPYLRITILRLQRTEKPYLRCLLVQVIANCLYYDATLTLSILQKLSVTAYIFNLWFQMLQQFKKNGARVNFKREHDKKVCCLGLTSLLVLPEAHLPNDALTRVFKATLDLLIAYRDQIAEAAKREEEEDDEMDCFKSYKEDDADSSDKNMGGNVEKISQADNDIKLQILESLKKALDRALSVYEDLCDYYSDDEEMLSPIDSVDPFIYFVEAIQVIQATDPSRFHNLTQALDPHYQTLAHSVTQYAEQRKTELEKQSMEKSAASTIS